MLPTSTVVQTAALLTNNDGDDGQSVGALSMSDISASASTGVIAARVVRD